VTVARPVVVACGDILGVAFDGEDEAVLFAPHSGDVLISEVAQWRALITPSLTESPADAPPLAGVAPPESELRATLRQLGVQFG
jgi:hypothetical protein